MNTTEFLNGLKERGVTLAFDGRKARVKANSLTSDERYFLAENMDAVAEALGTPLPSADEEIVAADKKPVKTTVENISIVRLNMNRTSTYHQIPENLIGCTAAGEVTPRPGPDVNPLDEPTLYEFLEMHAPCEILDQHAFTVKVVAKKTGVAHEWHRFNFDGQPLSAKQREKIVKLGVRCS